MKIPEKIRGLHLALIAILLLPLANWSGRIAGHWQSGRQGSTIVPTQQTPIVGRERDAEQERDARAQAFHPEAETRRLLSLWRRSPSPQLDFELGGEITRLVSRLTSEQIAEIFHALQGGTAEQRFLRAEIWLEWVLKDGSAAMNATGDTDFDRLYSISIFRNWMLERPEEALSWLNGDDVPPSLQHWKTILLRNSLIEFANKDPDFGLEQISWMERGEALENLSMWANRFVTRDDLRTRALAMAETLATPEELARLRMRLVESWSRHDPNVASEYLASLDLPESERFDLDARLSMDRRGLEPAERLDDWMARHPDAGEIPSSVQNHIASWLYQKPDEATPWLDNLAPGPLRDGIYERTVRAFVSFDKVDKAAAVAAEIESPEARSRAFLTLDRLWSDIDPNAAAAWREGLSADDRSLLVEP